MTLLLVGLMVLALCVLVAVAARAYRRGNMPPAQVYLRHHECHRIARLQRRAEHQINQLTHAAFIQMIEAVEQARNKRGPR